MKRKTTANPSNTKTKTQKAKASSSKSSNNGKAKEYSSEPSDLIRMIECRERKIEKLKDDMKAKKSNMATLQKEKKAAIEAHGAVLLELEQTKTMKKSLAVNITATPSQQPQSAK